MALAQINQTGGVLGQSIEPVIEDGANDWGARNLVSCQHFTPFGGLSPLGSA
jgi:hypothetical protein